MTQSRGTQPNVLLRSRQEAEADIQQRIEKGRELLGRDHTPESLEQADRDRQTWDEFNEQLLKALFSTDEIASEYSGRKCPLFPVLDPGATLCDLVDEFQRSVKESMRLLESIKERLAIIPVGTQPDANGDTERRDSVTELAERQTFDARLVEEIENARTQSQPLTLVMVDVDHFKKVNDSHGHPKGDAVLAEVARVLQSVTARKGQAYRYGGDEMVLVLPNHSLQEGIAVAERARREVESGLVEAIRITASFGVATYPGQAKTPEELVDAADKALYDAKNRGRNLVAGWGEPEPTIAQTPGAREPERRLPPAGRLTESQREELRQAHFRGHEIHCPDDNSILEVVRITAKGSVGELLIRCPMCGLEETLRRPDR